MRLSTLVAIIWLLGVGIAFLWVILGVLSRWIYRVPEGDQKPRINMRRIL